MLVNLKVFVQMTFSGYYLKNGVKCDLKFTNFKLGLDLNVISGQTDEYVVIGEIKNYRDFTMTLKTKDNKVCYFWG